MTKMIEVKTADLIGPALDWAVATIVWSDRKVRDTEWPSCIRIEVPVEPGSNVHFVYAPSTDWSQGGPLIDKYQIWLTGPYRRRTEWKAGSGLASDWDYSKSEFEGPTPLIAAMRCLVASKLGNTVQVPGELLP